jgi:hypothetical protein
LHLCQEDTALGMFNENGWNREVWVELSEFHPRRDETAQ